jgi:hypothetical protein
MGENRTAGMAAVKLQFASPAVLDRFCGDPGELDRRPVRDPGRGVASWKEIRTLLALD